MPTRHNPAISRIALAACSLALAPACLADEFRYQFDANAMEQSTTATDVDTRDYSGRFFFKPVNDTSGPMAEAQFLTRTGSVAVFASNTETTFQPFPFAGQVQRLATDFDVATIPFPPDGAIISFPPGAAYVAAPLTIANPSSENDAVGLRLDFVSESAWIASAELSNREASDGSFGLQSVEDGTAVEIEFGRYLAKLTTLSFAVGKATLDRETQSLLFFCTISQPCDSSAFPVSTSDLEESSYSLRAKHLIPKGNVYHALRGEIGYQVLSVSHRPAAGGLSGQTFLTLGRDINQDRLHAKIGYTFYPRRNWGMGLDVARSDTEGAIAQTYALNANWYITSSVALTGQFVRVNSDTVTNAIGIDDTDGFGIGLRGRF